jgi:hypothetical protein
MKFSKELMPFKGDFDAIIFNPISSTFLKWLRFKVVSWRHDFQPFTAMVWNLLIVGLLWLHHIQSLANVTMTTIAIGKVGKLVLPRNSCFKIKQLIWISFCFISAKVNCTHNYNDYVVLDRHTHNTFTGTTILL